MMPAFCNNRYIFIRKVSAETTLHPVSVTGHLISLLRAHGSISMKRAQTRVGSWSSSHESVGSSVDYGGADGLILLSTGDKSFTTQSYAIESIPITTLLFNSEEAEQLITVLSNRPNAKLSRKMVVFVSIGLANDV